MFSGAKPHSADRLSMDLPNESRMTWSTMISRTPSQDSESSFKLSMHDTGNDTVKFPMKPEHLDLLETSPNPNPPQTSQTTSPAKALQSRRTPTLALPRERVPLLNRRSPPLPICLPNSVKMEN